MNRAIRPYLRPLLLVLLACSFAACHFCGIGHHFGRHGGHRVPIRHCR